jgi:ABC-type nitrate/sulfonate/bicarbonate transport system permease component
MSINPVLADRQDTATAPTRRRRRRAPRSRGARLGYRIVGTAIALALWQLAVASGIASRAAVASPTSIVRAAGPLLSSAQFGTALKDTITSWAGGLFVSLLIAIPVGMLLGTSDLAYRMSRFTIDFLRTIPPVALIPLALLLYGATPKMAFVLIVFGSVWPLLLQSMYGVHQVEAAARDVARCYRLRRMDRVRFIILPSAAPFVATGIRLAATISLLLAVGAEIIGGAPGIGNAITLENQAGQIPNMWVYVVASAGLGVVVNLALIGLERRVLKWHSAHRSADVV